MVITGFTRLNNTIEFVWLVIDVVPAESFVVAAPAFGLLAFFVLPDVVVGREQQLVGIDSWDNLALGWQVGRERCVRVVFWVEAVRVVFWVEAVRVVFWVEAVLAVFWVEAVRAVFGVEAVRAVCELAVQHLKCSNLTMDSIIF